MASTFVTYPSFTELTLSPTETEYFEPPPEPTFPCTSAPGEPDSCVQEDTRYLAAPGSVDGCGLAPGPPLLTTNYLGYATWLLPTLVTYKRYLTGPAESDPGYGVGDALLSVWALIQIAVLVIGIYDAVAGYGVAVTDPGALATTLAVAMKLWMYRFGTTGEGGLALSRTTAQSMNLFYWVLVGAAFALALQGMVQNFGKPGIIVDTSLPDCLNEAFAFMDNNTTSLKVATPCLMIVGSIVITGVGWGRKHYRHRSGFSSWWSKGIAIFLMAIPVVLTLIDTFYGSGKRFVCGGCTLDSRAAYLNYQVNWWIDDEGRNRTGQRWWYKAQNIFQG
ncbi:hypothetical protein BDZ85DRAFT_250886 [Elsinoe ampelina]|uniref:Uncharacterized protein n=1 Tax=Elsinoe ampelina TaxID=302913 RepID=A0A6A6G8U1_9PEZI|nr:hypothetical protein BDZ85DRAFT_250886 [Elsinoe ampelina]